MMLSGTNLFLGKLIFVRTIFSMPTKSGICLDEVSENEVSEKRYRKAFKYSDGYDE